MSAGKKRNKGRRNPSGTPGNTHPPSTEQGALGDLLNRSAEGTHITDSREALNPAKTAAAAGIGKTSETPDSAMSAEIPAQPTHSSPLPSPAVQKATPVVQVINFDEPPPPVPAPAAAALPAVASPTIVSTTPATAPPAAPSSVSTSSTAPVSSPVPQSTPASPMPPATPDIMGEIRNRNSSRFKRLPGETSPRLLVTVALVMSLLVHVAIGMVMANQSAGKLAAPLVEEQVVDTFRVLAPPDEDPIYSDPLLTSNQTVATPVKEPGLGELGRMMLLNQTQASSITADETAPPAPQVPQHADVQPVAPDIDLATSSSALELPGELTGNLIGTGKVDLPIVTGNATDPVAAPSTATNAGPSTADLARAFLQGGPPGSPGSPGSGFSFGDNLTVPAPARPVVADAGPTVDRRLLEATATAPPIEITALALQEARTLDIPEKLDDDFDYVVTKFRPLIGGGLFQSAKPDQYTYFRVDVTAKRSLRKLKTMPKDVVFLVDTSGSVPQAWVNGITRGISDSLATLNEGDRFNIMFFSDKATLFSDDKIAVADTQTIARARQFLTGATSRGNTDINRSLTRLLQRDTSASRAYYLVLISDGVPTAGIMDTRELINLVTRDNDLAASIHCVGVGNSQNRELLNFLAYRNKGGTAFVKEPPEAAGAIRDLMSRIRYPIIKDVNLNVIGLDLEEVFPHNLPNIHQGETFSVYGRYETAGAFTMRVGGFNGIKGMDVTFGGDLRTAAIGKESIPEDWAFWKLHHLYSELIRRGESSEMKARIAELRSRFNLKTLY